MSRRLTGLLWAVVCGCLLGNSAAYAVSYELRGFGILPDALSLPAGIAGESITVSVVLNSDDFSHGFTYGGLHHYFLPETTIPVSVIGSRFGAYPNVSPIGRVIVADMAGTPGAYDYITFDVQTDNATTNLMGVYATDGDGFNGDRTPFAPTEMFELFAGAMQNEADWARTNSAVYIESRSNFLSLGFLDWTLVDLSEPPTQHASITPSFDVQLKPGNAYPLGNAAGVSLDIGGGFDESAPPLEVLMDFPLSQIPAGATIKSAQLKLDATASVSGLTIQALGYAGDGLASLEDEFADTSLIGSHAGPFSWFDDVTIDLDAAYIESLLGNSTHLGLRLKGAAAAPYLRLWSSERLDMRPPRLLLEFSTILEGDFDWNGVVDGDDFLAWQRGDSATPLSPAELDAWKANYGASTANNTAAAVPEPGACGMLLTALLAFRCRRRS